LNTLAAKSEIDEYVQIIAYNLIICRTVIKLKQNR